MDNPGFRCAIAVAAGIAALLVVYSKSRNAGGLGIRSIRALSSTV
jgi:hypothetical protein